MEQRCARKKLERKAGDKHDEGEDDLDICAIQRRCPELPRDDLHSILQIDPRHKETISVAGEASNVLQEIAPCLIQNLIRN